MRVIRNVVASAALLSSAACGGGTEPAPPPPPKTVQVNAVSASPNPVIHGKPFTVSADASAQHTSVDSIVIGYAGTNQKTAGASASSQFAASQSGPACATAYATGASPNMKCADVTVNVPSVSITGQVPTVAPTINAPLAVSATATAQHTNVDSIEATYMWTHNGKADSARIAAPGSRVAGTFTAKRPGSVRFRAYSKDAQPATDTKTTSVAVPVLIELRAFYRDSLTGIGPGAGGPIPPTNGIVTDSLDKAATTATVAGNTVTANNGYILATAPFGSATIGNFASPNRFISERIKTLQANGDSAFTFTYAGKPTATITTDESTLKHDTVKVQVYRVAPSVDPKRLNFANWNEYNQAYAGNGGEAAPFFKDVHTGFTANRILIQIYDGNQVIANLKYACEPSNVHVVEGARQAAYRAIEDLSDTDLAIEIQQTSNPDLVQSTQQGILRPANDHILLCHSSQAKTPTYWPNATASNQAILAWQGLVPTPNQFVDATQVPAYRYSFMQEAYNGLAGALAESPNRGITWFSNAGGFSGAQGLSPFDRDVTRMVNRYFMRPIQRTREAQAAAGQTMWPAYRLELPAKGS